MSTTKPPTHLLPLSLLPALLLPVPATAEFYSYEDRNGTLHFVDDPSHISKEYRNKKQVRKDKYDDLPEDERAAMLEKERNDQAAARQQEEAEQARSLQARKAAEARAASERQRALLSTPDRE